MAWDSDVLPVHWVAAAVTDLWGRWRWWSWAGWAAGQSWPPVCRRRRHPSTRKTSCPLPVPPPRPPVCPSGLWTPTLAVSLNIGRTEFKGVHRLCLRHARVAAVLFLPESVLLHKDVKALRLFPHVVKRHTLGDRSCCDLKRRWQ